MKPGDCLTLNIVSTSFDGRGIAKENGLVIFVNGAVEGDRVKAKVYTVHKSYATAGVTQIINYSPYRNENPCEYHGICGGCPLAHIKYEHQLKIKKQAVADAFTRIGRLSLDGVAFSETVGMETPYRYRNKMVFPTEDINGCPAGGFYASGSHDIVPINHCSAGSIVNISVLKPMLITAWLYGRQSLINPVTKKAGSLRLSLKIGTAQIITPRAGFPSRA